MRSRSVNCLFWLAAVVLIPSAAWGEPQQHCVRAEVVLWGDGKHDDTVPLNAWLRGEDAVWADSGEQVGGAISGHRFRLSDAIYVPAGSRRVLRDFRLEWPDRGETVSGGMLATGQDPN